MSDELVFIDEYRCNRNDCVITHHQNLLYFIFWFIMAFDDHAFHRSLRDLKGCIFALFINHILVEGRIEHVASRLKIRLRRPLAFLPRSGPNARDHRWGARIPRAVWRTGRATLSVPTVTASQPPLLPDRGLADAVEQKDEQPLEWVEHNEESLSHLQWHYICKFHLFKHLSVQHIVIFLYDPLGPYHSNRFPQKCNDRRKTEHYGTWRLVTHFFSDTLTHFLTHFFAIHFVHREFFHETVSVIGCLASEYSLAI